VVHLLQILVAFVEVLAFAQMIAHTIALVNVMELHMKTFVAFVVVWESHWIAMMNAMVIHSSMHVVYVEVVVLTAVDAWTPQRVIMTKMPLLMMMILARILQMMHTTALAIALVISIATVIVAVLQLKTSVGCVMVRMLRSRVTTFASDPLWKINVESVVVILVPVRGV
jgi:hypothetical protein